MKKKSVKEKSAGKVTKKVGKPRKDVTEFLKAGLRRKGTPTKYSFEAPKLEVEKVQFPTKEFKEEIKVEPKETIQYTQPTLQSKPFEIKPEIKIKTKIPLQGKAEQTRTTTTTTLTQAAEIKKQPEVKKEEKKEVKKPSLLKFILSLVIPIVLLGAFALLYYFKKMDLLTAIILFGVSLIVFDVISIVIKRSREKTHLKKEQKYQLVDITQVQLRPLVGYETYFDLLMELIEKNNALSVSQVSLIFKITKEKAEEWGRILEEHGLIEVFYPVFSEPQLRKKN